MQEVAIYLHSRERKESYATYFCKRCCYVYCKCNQEEQKRDFYIKEIIKNSLIFVLTLFEDEDDPPDLYNTLGKESSSLKNSEKAEFVSTLQEEFLS